MNSHVIVISKMTLIAGHQLGLFLLLFVFVVENFSGVSLAADSEPLDFSFINSPPGEFIQLDSHRLHVDCIGAGSVTVLFEPGLGGSAFEWQPIQQTIARRAQACVYDRAGYGWSDPSPFKGDVRQLASEADQMLKQVADSNKLIVVGHSFGGFVVRMLTKLRPEQVTGMVLVDASHEDQLARMETPGKTKILPSGRTFVISRTGIPENLPRELGRKVEAFSRLRKSYDATEREMRAFRESIDQVKQLRSNYSFPVKVLHRGLNPLSTTKDGEERHRIWGEMQVSLNRLSTDSEDVIGTNSGHHIHIDEPDLVINAIIGILDKGEAF